MEIKLESVCRGFAALMVMAMAAGYLAAGVAPATDVQHLQTAGEAAPTSGHDSLKDDGRITWAVKSELLAVPELESSSILVETQDAQVTLSGAVPHTRQAHRAIEVAGRVAGVKRINNRLVVSDGDAAREIDAMWRRLSV